MEEEEEEAEVRKEVSWEMSEEETRPQEEESDDDGDSLAQVPFGNFDFGVGGVQTDFNDFKGESH